MTALARCEARAEPSRAAADLRRIRDGDRSPAKHRAGTQPQTGNCSPQYTCPARLAIRAACSGGSLPCHHGAGSPGQDRRTRARPCGLARCLL